jgi:hypothetical protein
MTESMSERDSNTLPWDSKQSVQLLSPISELNFYLWIIDVKQLLSEISSSHGDEYEVKDLFSGMYCRVK